MITFRVCQNEQDRKRVDESILLSDKVKMWDNRKKIAENEEEKAHYNKMCLLNPNYAVEYENQRLLKIKKSESALKLVGFLALKQRKSFILKKITEKYCTYTNVKYLKMKNCKHIKKNVTVYDHRNVAYICNLETGETRHKTRDEVLQNIIQSKKRSLKKLREYVQSNVWQYFLTFTFDRLHQDRLNDKEVMKHLKHYLDDLRRLYPSIYYVCVPEYHKNGGLHFHMIIGGVTAAQLELKYWKSKKIKGGNGYQKIYRIKSFKYGEQTTATIVDNSAACGNYILKYVTKSLGIVGIGKKRYYATKNLLTPERSVVDNFVDYDFNIKNIVLDNFKEDLYNKVVFMTDKYICIKQINSETP